MKARLIVRTSFDAAHAVKIENDWEELHGHTFFLEVIVEGPIKHGYIMDFVKLRKTIESVTKEIDHRNLNKIFDNPTTENIALWLADKIKGKLPDKVILKRLVLWEGSDYGVELEW
ncbi:6-pyruvoyl tetrahydropterin synthase [Thermococcus chitonophagus]|uniref:6-pyruvoyl tetrahydropterin synthase n=1 Tax=Thermococcus chitonophagus TaxID=54262 RepID=A0A160VR82_9EURY|nr:6-pyruvoyl tetrahydropterin synthase family protein [Thermococcus chitonophagus]ASJ16670.1 6-pyruvoyl tetrahydropterin synthase [Thermococcus chitonophagus]CUX77405.1 Folate biosynthesis protein PTPS-III, catalyzes a reaction that bypasses dihydroneopterin aldolase (FolB) [Thermococcus chitonophagus]